MKLPSSFYEVSNKYINPNNGEGILPAGIFDNPLINGLIEAQTVAKEIQKQIANLTLIDDILKKEISNIVNSILGGAVTNGMASLASAIDLKSHGDDLVGDMFGVLSSVSGCIKFHERSGLPYGFEEELPATQEPCAHLLSKVLGSLTGTGDEKMKKVTGVLLTIHAVVTSGDAVDRMEQRLSDSISSVKDIDNELKSFIKDEVNSVLACLNDAYKGALMGLIPSFFLDPCFRSILKRVGSKDWYSETVSTIDDLPEFKGVSF